ncbi:DUF3152 domain-containing protein [Nocardioides sp.]|uniref:DUF3152 domain-containing protein n=1 Tax=Nocardioides sp. TaxID=35761 RepID=UPI0031FEB5D6|nr:hypothetical protein [Nocardioides sp.]
MGLGRVCRSHGLLRAAPVAVLAVLAMGAALMLAAPVAAAPTVVVNTVPPQVKGEPVYDSKLVAAPGQWEPAEVTYTYRWLRDGAPIAGATERTYRVMLDDLHHRIAVRVTATDTVGGSGTATSEDTDKVIRATLQVRRPPAVLGVTRFTHSVRATPGRWSATPDRLHFQWLRDGNKISGADGPRYRYVPADVGTQVRVRVTAKAPGYDAARTTSPSAGRVGHRVDVRRTVTYHVETRGRITTSVAAFGRLAQQTYVDPRGWRGSGIRFRRVARGGSFTLVLAEASRVPGFSSSCSSEWSCRVGRYVIINQERWKHASPAWNAAHGSLRDYRHMVVNHETGHWLGLGHAGCPGPGRPAPVMMQQSKGLGGCHFNPWPTLHEQAGRTPH